MITIIDYNSGNIKSVANALQKIGQPFEITSDPVKIKSARKIIFPGVGRAGSAMQQLKNLGLDKILQNINVPFLGVCLGMQLLFDRSAEDNVDCLGLIKGQIRKFFPAAKLKIPHIGWNQIIVDQTNPLFKNLPAKFYGYFVHSYCAEVKINSIAVTHYGQTFSSAVQKNNFFGVQFHPEKSGEAGLQILKNFCQLKPADLEKFQIFPCVDILDGQCVRLIKGNFAAKKVYAKNPLKILEKIKTTGAENLHVVDLDGASQGSAINKSLIMKIRKSFFGFMQVGGGIRNFKTADIYLKSGIDRIIISTSALKNSKLIKKLIKKYSARRLAVSIDLKNGLIATKAWTKTSRVSLKLFMKKLKNIGVKSIIYTDVNRDGTLSGPNYKGLASLINSGLNIIAAGGIASADDITKLKNIGLSGAIIGKAWYEGKIDLKKYSPVGAEHIQFLPTKRLIACFDIKNNRVVKGVSYANLKDAGDPVELAKLYEKMGADELVFLDITATIESRPTLYKLVEKIANQISIPFTVGGGIKTLQDISQLLKSGADKVSIGSSAVTNPDFIKKAAKQFGSQCLVISIDPQKKNNYYEIYINSGRTPTGLDAIKFAKKMANFGAGELLVNSIDRDGTRQGYDLKLLKAISQAVNIPVIASSGAGTKKHFLEAFSLGQADAALAASLFHFGEIEIPELKKYLQKNNIPVRPRYGLDTSSPYRLNP